jgi:hypothetical protein
MMGWGTFWGLARGGKVIDAGARAGDDSACPEELARFVPKGVKVGERGSKNIVTRPWGKRPTKGPGATIFRPFRDNRP